MLLRLLFVCVAVFGGWSKGLVDKCLALCVWSFWGGGVGVVGGDALDW